MHGAVCRYYVMSIFVVPEIYRMVCGDILVSSITIRREIYALRVTLLDRVAMDLRVLFRRISAVSPALISDCLKLGKGNNERPQCP